MQQYPSVERLLERHEVLQWQALYIAHQLGDAVMLCLGAAGIELDLYCLESLIPEYVRDDYWCPAGERLILRDSEDVLWHAIGLAKLANYSYGRMHLTPNVSGPFVQVVVRLYMVLRASTRSTDHLRYMLQQLVEALHQVSQCETLAHELSNCHELLEKASGYAVEARRIEMAFAQMRTMQVIH